MENIEYLNVEQSIYYYGIIEKDKAYYHFGNIVVIVLAVKKNIHDL